MDDSDLGFDEAAALVRLHDAASAIVDGVELCLPGWVIAAVDRLLDEWGRASTEQVAVARAAARDAGPVLARRLGAELRALFALDPSEQCATPLQVVRGAVREPTEILGAAGVAPVRRDPFEARAFPEDRYGLVPEALGDLGDPDLSPLLLVWGMAKAAVLRSRA